MAYGLEAELYLENERVAQVAPTRVRRAGFRDWRRLDQDLRLAAVDIALGRRPPVHFADGFPLAL